jgi:hypothetical protein
MSEENIVARILGGDNTVQWLLRAVALFLILLALQYWMKLIGATGTEAMRFDTMPEHWRLAASVLAVAMPVAALGLWAGSSWGLVIWIPIIAGEVTMYGMLTGLFGNGDIRIAVHLSALLLYCLLLLARYYYRKRMRKIAQG